MLRRIWLPGLIVVLTLLILIQSQRMQEEAMTSAIMLTVVVPPTSANALAFVPSGTPSPTLTLPPLPMVISATPLPPRTTPLPPTATAPPTATPFVPTAPPPATHTPLPIATLEPPTVPPPLPTEIIPSPTVSLVVTEIAFSAPLTPTSELVFATAAPPIDAPSTTYSVQRGDTLYQIALKYGVTVETLAAINNIADTSQIFVGQTLLISGAGLPIATSTLIPARASGRDVLMVSAAHDGSLPLPASIPPGIRVNNLTLADFLVMPPNVVENIQAVYEYGKILNRNPRAFSKLGDSTIENPHFLARFDETAYHLGEYTYLQPVIDYYHGSFSRQSRAVIRGLHTWSVLDPMWAGGCLPGENMLACEFRIHNPALIFVRLGSNDKGVPASTEKHLREIINYCLGNGIIPIMGTKADRFDGADNINNQIIRRIATELKVPLWDFDLLAGTIPGRGLGADNVHMTTFFAHDWTLPEAYTTGNGVHSITALMVLDAVWRVLNE